jgi:hypothetical protein
MNRLVLILGIILMQISLVAVCHKLGGYDTPGSASSVSVVGNIAYVADGNGGLQIIDITEPENSVLLGSANTARAYSLTLRDSLVYVANAAGLHIFDVTNPASPALLGHYYDNSHPFNAHEVVIVDSLAYLAASNRGLLIINISNPANQVLLGRYAAPSWVTSIAVVNNIAYLADDYAGLLCVDVSNPFNPILIGWYNLNAYSLSVRVDNNVAYVGNGSQGLQIIDVSNPSSPVLLATYDAPGYFNSVTVENNKAYVTMDARGLLVLDVSDPGNPVQLGVYGTNDYATSVSVNGDTAYLTASNAGLQIIDVTESQHSLVQGGYITPGLANCVAVNGNRAFVTQNDVGLQVFNVSDPQHPTLHNSYFNSLSFYGVDAVGSTAYLAWDSGLKIVDTYSWNAYLLGTYYTTQFSLSVKVVGTRAYVANYEAGLYVIDISNTQLPELLGWCDTPGKARGVAVVNSIAYVADGYSGLQIFDFTNPLLPAFLGSYDTPGYAYAVTVENNFAYVSDGAEGLQIIDVGNPQSPVLVNTILPHHNSIVKTSLLHNGRLYVSDYNWNEIRIYSVANPQLPRLLDTYAWNLCTYGMAIQNDMLYTANGYYGLNIHNLSDVATADQTTPAPVMELRCYPNPLHSNATISFDVPKGDDVQLQVYNIKGQLVRELCAEYKQAGSHSVDWDCRDRNGRTVPAGIYLIKCKIGKQSWLTRLTRL